MISEGYRLNDSIKNRKDAKEHYHMVMVLSFVLPVIMMTVTYAMKSIYLGGKFTLLISDLYKQYMPLYASLRYLFKGDSNLFYSFFGALGSNYLGTFAYYLSNPLSWLSVLFPLEYIPDYFYFMTLIRFGLIGLFFCIYLYHAFPEKRNPLFAVLTSCGYALMSYNVIYSFSLMWLDIVMLLPLLLLGVEFIIAEKKSTFFTVSLILCLLFNFYLTYMAGIFSFIYLIYRLFYENKKEKTRYLIRYFKSTFISFGIMLPFVFPSVMSVFMGKGKEAEESASVLIFHHFYEVIKQMLPCQYDTIETYGLPSVFCGSLTLILFVSALFVKNLTSKQKVLNISIFVIFLLSFTLLPLDNFWHGFRSPVFFPARYSFTFCFFMLSTAYQSAGYVLKRVTDKFKIKKSDQTLIRFLVVGFVFVELFLNGGYVLSMLSTQTHYRLRSEYDRYLANITPILNEINKDETFYRVSFDNPYSMCEGAFLGVNAIGWYSSSYNRDSLELFGKLGYEQWNNYLRDCGGTPLTESLFGVKYKISYMEKSKSLDYDQVFYSYPYTLYNNPGFVSLGFSFEISEETNELTEDVFFNQNMIMSDLMGLDTEIFHSLDYIITSNVHGDYPFEQTIAFSPESSDPVWIYINDAPYEEIIKWLYEETDKGNESEWADVMQVIQSFVTLPDGTNIAFFNENKNFSVCLGSFDNCSKAEICIQSTIPFGEVYVYSFDEEAFEECINSLSAKEIKDVYCHNGRITGTIDVPELCNEIFISLPFMKGYHITVDGMKTEYSSYRNALLSVPVTSGKHIIEIEFISPGIVIGIMLGIMSLVLAFILGLFEIRAFKEKKL